MSVCVCVIAQRHLNMYKRDMLFIGEKQKNQKESEKNMKWKKVTTEIQ